MIFCHQRHTQGIGRHFYFRGPSSGGPLPVFSLRDTWATLALMHVDATWGSSSSAGNSLEVRVLGEAGRSEGRGVGRSSGREGTELKLDFCSD